MALIPCPRCGEQISDTAYYCVHCGAPLKNIKSNHVRNKKTPPKWLLYVAVIAALTLMIFLIVSTTCIHEYTPATCTTPETCIKCGAIQGNALGHSWKIISCDKPRICSRCGEQSNTITEHDWHISGDEISCKKCKSVLTSAEVVKAKKGRGLNGADRALIYNSLDSYLTAQNSNGKYTYTESDAFRIVQDKYGVTKDYIDNNVWNYHAYEDYTLYR